MTSRPRRRRVGAQRRLGSDRAPVRMARAEGLRADAPDRPVWRTPGRACPWRPGAAPRRTLRTQGRPFRCASMGSLFGYEADPPGMAPARDPAPGCRAEGRVSSLQPPRSQRLLRALRPPPATRRSSRSWTRRPGRFTFLRRFRPTTRSPTAGTAGRLSSRSRRRLERERDRRLPSVGTSAVFRILRRWAEDPAGLDDRPHGTPPGLKVTSRLWSRSAVCSPTPNLGEFRIHAALAQIGIDLAPDLRARPRPEPGALRTGEPEVR